MKAKKSIMDSHEAYLQALNKTVTHYTMEELLEFQRIARSSVNYIEYNLIYTKEIERRKQKIDG